MAAEEETESWQWADADGVVSIVDEWELISSLSTGTLPAYTLVWRETWKEWLPACQVAELANVLPRDQVEKAVSPVIDKSMKEPPPPPTDKYQTFRAREAASRLLGKARALKTPVPPPPGKTPPPPKPGLGAPPARPRPVQPTIVETTTTPATATLRPPGAVPPPPRGVPVPATLPASLPRDPGRKITDALAAPMTPTIQLLDSGPSSEQPTNPRASAGPLPSYVDDDDAELRARALRPGPVSVHLPTTAPPPAATPKGTSIGMVSVLGIAIIVALGLVIGSIVIVKMRADEVPSASASGTSGKPATLAACKLVKPARRLATPIEASVNPNWVAYGTGFAVGYAETARVAGGITLDPIALEPKRVFDQKVSTNILGVVPLTQGALGFEPDLDEGDLNPKRTLDTRPRISVGVTSAGFSRQEGKEESSTIWPGSGADKETTDPRLAPLPGGGYAVTLRRGGISGSVLVGLLDKDGRRASDLLVIGAKPQVGTPNVAANSQGVLVAFAGRPSNDAYWKLQLAKSNLGDVPRSASSFPSPPGGPGGDEISPVAVGLERGGWLLQWTEGPAGRRQVRLQTVGFDLIPVGDPITVSPEQANAGQGVVMVREGKALSLFLVKQGKNHELWGASLICP